MKTILYATLWTASLSPWMQGQTEILQNGGFESGLAFWTEEVGAGEGNVITQTAGIGCQAIDPGVPRSGSFLFSSAVTDGATLRTPEITLHQIVDVSTFSWISTGIARLSATAYVSGAPGCGGTSDDTVQIQVEFWQGGTSGALLDSRSTTPLDPVVGFWNQISLQDFPVPAATDTILFRYRTLLDPGWTSIDIGADDLSLALSADALILDASPNQVSAGQSLQFQSFPGAPGSFVWLYVIGVDGTPLFLRVARDAFDQNCEWMMSSVVPPGLSGLDVDFQAFGFAKLGRLMASNVETVSFL